MEARQPPPKTPYTYNNLTQTYTHDDEFMMMNFVERARIVRDCRPSTISCRFGVLGLPTSSCRPSPSLVPGRASGCGPHGAGRALRRQRRTRGRGVARWGEPGSQTGAKPGGRGAPLLAAPGL